MLPVLSLECSESHTRRVSTDTLINSDLMFHLLFDVAVKTTWAAPLAAHVWCCLQRDWSQTKCHWHRQSCICAEAHTVKKCVQQLQLFRFWVGFPVHHQSAYNTFHGGTHACHAISGCGNLLKICRTTWGKRGRPGYSLQLEDYNLIRTYCWQWKL